LAAAPAPAGDLDTPVGMFTTAVIAAFASPATDRDRDGLIELSELVDAVTSKVAIESRDAATGLPRQTPLVSRRELFGDFVVGPRL
jgi:hypothetical protein